MDLPPVERWCPACERVYQATVTIEETTRIESPCPTCGEPGQPLLRYEAQ